MNKKRLLALGIFIAILAFPQTVFGMHIMEGFLPPVWCISWGALTIPFLLFGFRSIQNKINANPKVKILIAMSGAFSFVLSAIKFASFTESSSHLTGVGFGAILFGPSVMSILGLIVLIFQALLLAHGGLTTLGANTFSMAVVGPLVSYGTFKLVKLCKGPQGLAIFLGAFLGDLSTYATTSIQLALAHPEKTGGFLSSLLKFMSIFAITQIPLAVIEGILTVIIFNSIANYSKTELEDLKVISKEVL